MEIAYNVISATCILLTIGAGIILNDYGSVYPTALGLVTSFHFLLSVATSCYLLWGVFGDLENRNSLKRLSKCVKLRFLGSAMVIFYVIGENLQYMDLLHPLLFLCGFEFVACFVLMISLYMVDSED